MLLGLTCALPLVTRPPEYRLHSDLQHLRKCRKSTALPACSRGRAAWVAVIKTRAASHQASALTPATRKI